MNKNMLFAFALLGAILVGALGALVGRWFLPNNGPCTVDYGLVAAWVGAIAAAGLVVVGGIAARYAC